MSYAAPAMVKCANNNLQKKFRAFVQGPPMLQGWTSSDNKPQTESEGEMKIFLPTGPKKKKAESSIEGV